MAREQRAAAQSRWGKTRCSRLPRQGERECQESRTGAMCSPRAVSRLWRGVSWRVRCAKGASFYTKKGGSLVMKQSRSSFRERIVGIVVATLLGIMVPRGETSAQVLLPGCCRCGGDCFISHGGLGDCGRVCGEEEVLSYMECPEGTRLFECSGGVNCFPICNEVSPTPTRTPMASATPVRGGSGGGGGCAVVPAPRRATAIGVGGFVLGALALAVRGRRRKSPDGPRRACPTRA